MKTFKLFWNTHKWVGIIIAVLILNTSVTGILLLYKKQYDWLQPPSADATSPGTLSVSFDEILESVRTNAPEAGLTSWDDIDRLDVRPDKGLVKVRGLNRWEVQVDGSTGEVLQVMYRRSDLIEQIHDGSFFAGWFHDWLMPAFAVSLIFMTFSGFWIWLEPKYRRAQRKKKERREQAEAG